MYHDYDLQKILDHIRSHSSPDKKKKVIIDSDAYNEIDDQFAIAYAMLSDDIDVLAINAAPFSNERSTGPDDGMKKSYEEILRLHKCIDPNNERGIPCYRGSTEYMKNTVTPVKSDAAENIVRLVNESDDIVYIAMLGCFTNVASALLLDPSIMEKAVIVMIGTQAFDLVSANDFNLKQDRIAARIIFECGIPVIILPVEGSTDKVQLSNAEMTYYLKDQAGEIGNFLCNNIYEDNTHPINENDGHCDTVRRGLVDVAAIAFLRGTDKMMELETIPAHSIDSNGNWRCLDEKREMLYVPLPYTANILSDMYTVLRTAAKK